MYWWRQQTKIRVPSWCMLVFIILLLSSVAPLQPMFLAHAAGVTLLPCNTATDSSWLGKRNINGILDISSLPYPRHLQLEDCSLSNAKVIFRTDPAQRHDEPLLIGFRNVEMLGGLVEISAPLLFEGNSTHSPIVGDVCNVDVVVEDSMFSAVHYVFNVQETQLHPLDNVENVSMRVRNVTVSTGTIYEAFTVRSQRYVSNYSLTVTNSSIATAIRAGVVTAFSVENVKLHLGDDSVVTAGSAGSGYPPGQGAFGIIHEMPEDPVLLLQEAFPVRDTHISIVGSNIQVSVVGVNGAVCGGILAISHSRTVHQVVENTKIIVEGENIILAAQSRSTAVAGLTMNTRLATLSMASVLFRASGSHLTISGAPGQANDGSGSAILGVAVHSRGTGGQRIVLSDVDFLAAGNKLTLFGAAGVNSVTVLGVAADVAAGSDSTSNISITNATFAIQSPSSNVNINVHSGRNAVSILGVANSNPRTGVAELGIEVSLSQVEWAVEGDSVVAVATSVYTTTILGTATFNDATDRMQTQLAMQDVTTRVAGNNIMLSVDSTMYINSILGEVVNGGGHINVEQTRVAKWVSGTNIAFQILKQTQTLAAILGVATNNHYEMSQVTVVDCTTTIFNTSNLHIYAQGQQAVTIGGYTSFNGGTTATEAAVISIVNSSVCISEVVGAAIVLQSRLSGGALFSVIAFADEGPAVTAVTSSHFTLTASENVTMSVELTPNLKFIQLCGILSVLTMSIEQFSNSVVTDAVFAVTNSSGVRLGFEDHKTIEGPFAILSILTACENHHTFTVANVSRSQLAFDAKHSALLMSLDSGTHTFGLAILSVLALTSNFGAHATAHISDTTAVLNGSMVQILLHCATSAGLVLSFSAHSTAPTLLSVQNSTIVVAGEHLQLGSRSKYHCTGIALVVAFSNAHSPTLLFNESSVLVHATVNFTVSVKGYHAVGFAGVIAGDGAPTTVNVTNSQIGMFVDGGEATISSKAISGVTILGINTYWSAIGQTFVDSAILAVSTSSGGTLSLGALAAGTSGDAYALCGIYSYGSDLHISNTTIQAFGPHLIFKQGVTAVAAAGIRTAEKLYFLDALNKIEYCSVAFEGDSYPIERLSAGVLKSQPTGTPSDALNVVNRDKGAGICPDDEVRWVAVGATTLIRGVVEDVAKAACSLQRVDSDPALVTVKTATASYDRTRSLTLHPATTRSPTSSIPLIVDASTRTVTNVMSSASASKSPTTEVSRTTTLVGEMPSPPPPTTTSPPTLAPTPVPDLNDTTTAPPTLAPPKSVSVKTVLPVSSGDAEALEGSTAVSTALSGGLTSPTASANVARIGAALRTINCPLSEDDMTPSSIEHPIQFAVGTSPFRHLVGSTMGSTILLLVLFLLKISVTFISSVKDVAPVGVVKLFSILAIVSHAYFTPNICGTATTVLVHSDDATDRIVAFICALVPVGELVYFAFFINKRSTKFLEVRSEKRLSAYEEEKSEDSSSTSSGSTSSDSEQKNTSTSSGSNSTAADDGKKILAPRSAVAGSNQFWIRFGILVDATIRIEDSKALNYYLVDVVVATISTIAAGTRPSSNCVFVASTVFLISIAALIYHVLIRPFERALDTLFAILIAANQAILGILTIIIIRNNNGGDGEEDSSLAMDVIGYFLMFQIAVFFIQTIVQAFWSVVRLQRRRHLKALESEDTLSQALLVPMTSVVAGTAKNAQFEGVEKEEGAKKKMNTVNNPLLNGVEEDEENEVFDSSDDD